MFSLFIFIGCQSSPRQNNQLIIEGEDLYFLLVADNKLIPSQGSVLADRYYYPVDIQWLKKEYKNKLAKKMYGRIWTKESGDCDDATVLAKSLSSEMQWFDGKASLALGEFYYVNRNDVGHAIIIFVYSQSQKLNVGFLEPQTGEIIELTEAERNSCSFWKI